MASYLSTHKEKKVLLMDLDPQSNSTQVIIPEDKWDLYYGENSSRSTIYDFFDGMDNGEPNLSNLEVSFLAKDSKFKVDLIPGHPNLSVIDDLMSSCWDDTIGQKKGGLRKLNWLNQIKEKFKNYDYILIDVGPSLGALNRSILLNSDYFFTPMASDIFSLLGVKNIASWMNRWMKLYEYALNTFELTDSTFNLNEYKDKYLVNINVKETTRFIGYSIQQYSKRKYKSGIKTTQAYENVISEIRFAITSHLNIFRKNGLNDEDIKIGDIPYVYSVVPLSQTSNVPIFDLTYKDGVRGNQISSVNEYKEFMEHIATRFIKNVGETNE
ncbi:cellulose biosynthesis protein BcsQ [Clostridium saccharoperbutylacetonicum]|uniref:CobQ/CobB/MinD/ParA nucleotide binding domain-containing protein n=1 Tax=Clostridium saccharoperbutylacetonicum N1-4(HMT) TaxID=931276 RepID=M1MSX5_9CLOT|nr:CobQ/CobB/MinD/ParA nucleotide binding domain-containing protein [Clostridium saccharoperbutylacetonicum N1-4(HMT)]NSB44111.1 cellulose biosynthesis protein BcsQ [Clostridium saccharoperbutylacetonicum]